MSIKWFSGGKERKNEAIMILEGLIKDLDSETKNLPVQKVLSSYRKELIDEPSFIPFILSRMNIEVSKVLVDNGIELSHSQSEKLKKLSSLSQIRYGY
ncbi:bacteriocin immunity protein [Enterococcus cecorum]|uniref:bacteriocin immunity protein n=1 Tax=Enterococcus cecorum TaxID=44008 RepID=UPI0031F5913A